jgi:RHS repeat-associated protein
VFEDTIDGVVMLEQADLLDFDSDSNTSETTRSFYHRNALGSVMEITAMDQAVEVTYRYEPYGKVRITRGGAVQSSDPLGQPWMFTARSHDEETATYHYRARHYDPSTGRFLQRDPLGHGSQASPYEYVSSAPTNRVDPMGLREGFLGVDPASSPLFLRIWQLTREGATKGIDCDCGITFLEIKIRGIGVTYEGESNFLLDHFGLTLVKETVEKQIAKLLANMQGGLENAGITGTEVSAENKTLRFPLRHKKCKQERKPCDIGEARSTQILFLFFITEFMGEEITFHIDVGLEVALVWDWRSCAGGNEPAAGAK